MWWERSARGRLGALCVRYLHYILLLLTVAPDGIVALSDLMLRLVCRAMTITERGWGERGGREGEVRDTEDLCSSQSPKAAMLLDLCETQITQYILKLRGLPESHQLLGPSSHLAVALCEEGFIVYNQEV